MGRHHKDVTRRQSDSQSWEDSNLWPRDTETFCYFRIVDNYYYQCLGNGQVGAGYGRCSNWLSCVANSYVRKQLAMSHARTRLVSL